jgi:hypothetical protein
MDDTESDFRIMGIKMLITRTLGTTERASALREAKAKRKAL